MTVELTGTLREIRKGAVPRMLLADVLDLAEREGILERIQRYAPVSRAQLCRVLQSELGYALETGNRERMIGLLLSLLAECGRLREQEGLWSWEPTASGAHPEGERSGARPEDEATRADAQYRFLRQCLESMPAYLRGCGPSLLFDARHTEVWDAFLGCAEFRACRALLLELMKIEDRPTFRLLDLCHGPGFGLEVTTVRFPSVCLTAIDFTGAFRRHALRRVETAQRENRRLGRPMAPVTWMGPEAWKGFGNPLPFHDGSFEAVLFSCGDPYVPSHLRRQVYGEITRVLAPGGRLGVLTRCRPDAAARHVPSFWLRVAALVHDFAESVCEGWEGFRDAEEQMQTLAEVGFQGGIASENTMSMLESCLWVLRKRPANA
jgi:SAM-dependent methyltransferase